jgi:hypothetical protein
MEYDRSKMDWVDHPEQIWVVFDESMEMEGAIHGAHSTEQGAQIAIADKLYGPEPAMREITLHRPSLRAVYGGPTLLEALWNRMDVHMEALMTGQEAEDTAAGARELAWVIAIVTNAYSPSIPWVKEEAMRRWNEAQAEADAQEEALNPDQDDVVTRPEGADQ